MRIRPLMTLFILFAALVTLGSAKPRHSRAEFVHFSSLVVDGHNDLPWALRAAGDVEVTHHDLASYQEKFHTDFPRMRAGGVGAQFWSVYVPAENTGEKAAQLTREQIEIVHRLVKKYPQYLAFADSTESIRKAVASGKIASLIGMEGGHSINESLETLEEMYSKGARYMTLSHSKNLSWVEASTDVEMAEPLNDFGRDVVRKMNELGMFVDISHISARAMRAVLDVAKAPVIASHSSAFALKNHPRNVPDDVLRRVADQGGVVMVNFYPAFIGKEEIRFNPNLVNSIHAQHNCVTDDLNLWKNTGRVPYANVKTVVDHIEHIVKVAGIDHVGLGSDFDGIPTVPEGLEDVSKFPAITEELLARGYSDSDIRKILGENLMRAFRAVEELSDRKG